MKGFSIAHFFTLQSRQCTQWLTITIEILLLDGKNLGYNAQIIQRSDNTANLQLMREIYV